MTFDDIFKSSFLQQATDLSILDMLLAMGFAFALGLFIFFIYKRTFTGVMYSASFGVSIMAMTLITTLIILAVTSNIILSLGMVGALSIVRFRTAVKDPLDIAFLFWAISVGIVVGAGLLPLAVICSLIIGVVLLVFVNRKSNDTPYVLVLSLANDAAENQALKLIDDDTRKNLIKSKTVSDEGIELTVEVRLKEPAAKVVNELKSISGVNSACLVSFNGEYAS
ncbi:MAG: DUF4956 domain-containing protein [Chloroflexi bacterium]|jgi:uncharacterized membrane protein YhiD involved in acid resistance|nr:DUF4956 domain-containing protein [Chloroflexota bacterium]